MNGNRSNNAVRRNTLSIIHEEHEVQSPISDTRSLSGESNIDKYSIPGDTKEWVNMEEENAAVDHQNSNLKGAHNEHYVSTDQLTSSNDSMPSSSSSSSDLMIQSVKKPRVRSSVSAMNESFQFAGSVHGSDTLFHDNQELCPKVVVKARPSLSGFKDVKSSSVSTITGKYTEDTSSFEEDSFQYLPKRKSSIFALGTTDVPPRRGNEASSIFTSPQKNKPSQSTSDSILLYSPLFTKIIRNPNYDAIAALPPLPKATVIMSPEPVTNIDTRTSLLLSPGFKKRVRSQSVYRASLGVDKKLDLNDISDDETIETSETVQAQSANININVMASPSKLRQRQKRPSFRPSIDTFSLETNDHTRSHWDETRAAFNAPVMVPRRVISKRFLESDKTIEQTQQIERSIVANDTYANENKPLFRTTSGKLKNIAQPMALSLQPNLTNTTYTVGTMNHIHTHNHNHANHITHINNNNNHNAISSLTNKSSFSMANFPRVPREEVVVPSSAFLNPNT